MSSKLSKNTFRTLNIIEPGALLKRQKNRTLLPHLHQKSHMPSVRGSKRSLNCSTVACPAHVGPESYRRNNGACLLCTLHYYAWLRGVRHCALILFLFFFAHLLFFWRILLSFQLTFSFYLTISMHNCLLLFQTRIRELSVMQIIRYLSDFHGSLTVHKHNQAYLSSRFTSYDVCRKIKPESAVSF